MEGMGVDKKTDVAACLGFLVAAGYSASGVDADNVANKLVVGVGADVPILHARSVSRNPAQIKSRLSILFLN